MAETDLSADLDTLKLSLRVDGEADDTLLQGYLTAAKNYVMSAVGTETDAVDFYSKPEVAALYSTAVLALASTYYTYRAALSAVTVVPVDLTVNSIIGQLRGLYAEVVDVDESNQSVTNEL